jgi:hypothetical protein
VAIQAVNRHNTIDSAIRRKTVFCMSPSNLLNPSLHPSGILEAFDLNQALPELSILALRIMEYRIAASVG